MVRREGEGMVRREGEGMVRREGEGMVRRDMRKEVKGVNVLIVYQCVNQLEPHEQIEGRDAGGVVW